MGLSEAGAYAKKGCGGEPTTTKPAGNKGRKQEKHIYVQTERHHV